MHIVVFKYFINVGLFYVVLLLHSTALKYDLSISFAPILENKVVLATLVLALSMPLGLIVLRY